MFLISCLIISLNFHFVENGVINLATHSVIMEISLTMYIKLMVPSLVQIMHWFLKASWISAGRNKFIKNHLLDTYLTQSNWSFTISNIFLDNESDLVKYLLKLGNVETTTWKFKSQVYWKKIKDDQVEFGQWEKCHSKAERI